MIVGCLAPFSEENQALTLEVKYFSAAVTAWCPCHVFGGNSHRPNDFKFLLSNGYELYYILITMHSLQKLDLNTKKTTPDLEVCSESRRAMLEYSCTEHGLCIMLLLNLSVVVPLDQSYRVIVFYTIFFFDRCCCFFKRKKKKKQPVARHK